MRERSYRNGLYAVDSSARISILRGGPSAPNGGRSSVRMGVHLMTHIPPPGIRPADARFSSGPTKKRPGWNLQALEGALLGRSHRSKPGKAKLKEAIDRTRALLGVPCRFQDRDRAGIRHRRGGNGDVVDAGRAPGRCIRLGKLRRGMGDRCGRATEARGLPHSCRPALRRAAGSVAGARNGGHRLHAERNDLGCEDSELRLDPGGSRGHHVQ